MKKIRHLPDWLVEPANEHQLTSWLFLKGLALVYLAAFLSLSVQIDGLAGPDGILPFGELLKHLFTEFGYSAWLKVPTLFWFNSSSLALQGAAIMGVILAVALLLGLGMQRLNLILLFVLYLSLYHAGQVFMSFQWDFLLLECGFLAIFLLNAPSHLVIFLYHWLLFRLRFLSGFSKLASGDPSWSSFTTLNYYFETQPLPHIGSWYAHQLPEWLLKSGVGLTFFAELIVPFFIFLPRPFRIFAAIVTIIMQLLIMATSNHNFINLLTILLCLFLLDDKIVGRVLPSRLQERIRASIHTPGLLLKTLTGAFAILIMAISLNAALSMLSNRPLPRALHAFTTLGPRYGIGNVYHVFPNMQTERQELLIAGSYDGIDWEPYLFRYKPDALEKTPAFIMPHHPRLDWMMWFIPPQNEDVGYWFIPFMRALQDNRPAVTNLLAHNPFEGKKPPKLLRVVVFRYRFTTATERAQTGDWWKTEYLGEFPDTPPRRP